MRIAEMLVQDGEKHDDILHNLSMPVNIRLYNENGGYANIVRHVIEHMLYCAQQDYDDYDRAQGISGANIGIPFNIVVVMTKIGFEIFLNPEILAASHELVECQSNCGSVNLPEKIKVMRHRWVKVRWYSLAGDERIETFRIGDDNHISSATLQHEIEHNNGVLITDKAED